MRESLLRMEFYETYYYANIVHNVLGDTFDFLRNLHSWHEDREVSLFLRPFPKRSVLHSFSEYVIEDLMYETLDDVSLDSLANNPKAELWVDRALKHHGIEAPGFRQWLAQRNVSLADASEDDVHDYHTDLRLTGELDDLMTQLANEVFYVLFSNRTLLARLNGYIAGVVGEIGRDQLQGDDALLLQKDGVPTRAYIPEWARRAVYFRDRGMCASCNTDLSGLVSVSSVEHYDHIIPLAEGGINDVTNLQLLCQACNLSKGKRRLATSNKYQAWYSSEV
ncbi:HNH endonuclease [Methylomonas sp. MO1]|uniref:HNH endonuclease n=1 Tax=Methylomonas sp. MO1 TaxID=3073619 RepID=UPI0028A4F257|nr:HNH endonuclease [Methylomonas sp. MO1]MDT4288003.1 HNH endonuclease [Methylomonas sp. MO1]